MEEQVNTESKSKLRLIVLISGISTVSICILAFLLTSWRTDSYPGAIYDSYEVEKDGLHLKVIAQHEKSYGFNFVPGAYYTFYSRSNGAKEWVEVMRFRHDDPNPVPRQNVAIQDGGIAFAFVGWKLMVTSDWGKSWTVWDASQSPVKSCTNYKFIESVDIDRNGHGRMQLEPLRSCATNQLETVDFGKTWIIPRA